MMTKFIALAALLLLPGMAYAQKQCDQYRTAQTTGPTGPTERVAGVPNKRIYICGYMIMRGLGGADLEFQMTSGQGTNCNGNTQVIIPRLLIPVNSIVNRVAEAASERTLPGHAICLQTWGTGPVTSIFY
jgi:hypothetical protein